MSNEKNGVLMLITNILLAILIVIMGFSAYYIKNFVDGNSGKDKKSVPTVKIQEPTKHVTACMSYLVGATSDLECSGDFSGKTTMQELYKDGWHYISNISGTSKFVLVFEK